jgi:hypothetical protein
VRLAVLQRQPRQQRQVLKHAGMAGHAGISMAAAVALATEAAGVSATAANGRDSSSPRGLLRVQFGSGGKKPWGAVTAGLRPPAGLRRRAVLTRLRRLL